MNILKQKLPSCIYYKLLEGNIDSLKIILTKDELTLQQLAKLSGSEIKLVKQIASEIVMNDKFVPAIKIPHWQRITSGCASVDSITQGGIPVNGITEIFGASGVGKTQFCLQLALTVQFPVSLGGLNKGAVYICTEDVFPAKRLNQLTRTFPLRFVGLDVFKYEDNIFLDHITDFEQLRRCLYVRLPNLLMQNNVGIIIIDSIAGIFRSETIDVNYTSRSQEFMMITSQLNKLGREFGLAIVCVNQVTDNVLIGKTEPCLGLAWSNLINYRFSLSRLGKLRTFEIVFTPDLPISKCNFVIKDIGLAEPEK